MKRYYVFVILIALFVVGCGPSPDEVTGLTAAAKTQIAAAWTATPTSTLEPTSTPQPSLTPTSTPFPESALSVRLDTIPYRGVVLIIEYTDASNGIESLSMSVDVAQNGRCIQDEEPVQLVDGNLVAEIIDFKYSLGMPLDISIELFQESVEIQTLSFSLPFEQYAPWMDWMLQPGDETYIQSDNCGFSYDCPYSPNGLGAHASWDFMTHPEVPVYSGTEGVIYHLGYEAGLENVYIYNPHVGGIIQYGHCLPIDGLSVGDEIHPGDHIATVTTQYPGRDHIHYSVIRPIGWDSSGWPYWWDEENISVFEPKYYQDTFYFHEPATLGYWYEETLPIGWKDQMMLIFRQNNPDLFDEVSE